MIAATIRLTRFSKIVGISILAPSLALAAGGIPSGPEVAAGSPGFIRQSERDHGSAKHGVRGFFSVCAAGDTWFLSRAGWSGSRKICCAGERDQSAIQSLAPLFSGRRSCIAYRNSRGGDDASKSPGRCREHLAAGELPSGIVPVFIPAANSESFPESTVHRPPAWPSAGSTGPLPSKRAIGREPV